MIISHEHRFIFFAVPRTATHAIRQALRPHLGADDWEQQVLFGEQHIPIAAIANLKHGHISFQQIQSHLPADTWKSYFKFGFVRNPFDRFVSTCVFLNRRNPDFPGREAAFMSAAIGRERFRQRILVVPQYQLLADEEGRVMMDYVGRYETLQESFDDVCRRIDIPSTELDRKNASTHDRFETYYDAGLRAAVAEFYRMDFELFGYDSNSLAPDEQLTSQQHA